MLIWNSHLFFQEEKHYEVLMNKVLAEIKKEEAEYQELVGLHKVLLCPCLYFIFCKIRV